MTEIHKLQMYLKEKDIAYVIGHEGGETQIISEDFCQIMIAHFDVDGARK